jgi:uncharacterized protein YggU (UPF0235/DUF167 family)
VWSGATTGARPSASGSRAVPDKGRANAAVVALIAKALEVPKSAVAVVSGETARLKTVLVSGDAATLAERLGGLLR